MPAKKKTKPTSSIIRVSGISKELLEKNKIKTGVPYNTAADLAIQKTYK